MASVDDDEDAAFLALPSLIWRWALYKDCSSGGGASVFTPYDRSYGRAWSHGTPSFALCPLVRLPLDFFYLPLYSFPGIDLISSIYSPFPVETK